MSIQRDSKYMQIMACPWCGAGAGQQCCANGRYSSPITGDGVAAPHIHTKECSLYEPDAGHISDELLPPLVEAMLRALYDKA